MNRIAAIAFASVLASTAQADQNSAFQDAKSFAGGKTQGVFTGISSGAVSDKIPGYGTNPSEAQFFQGGQGSLSGPGVTKMQNCSNYTPGENKIANQECEAVNFLARNPDVRPQFNIGSNDPIVISAKEARKNAESLFQTLDINGGAEGSTQCTTKTTTTPTQYTTETCTSLRAIEGQQCTMGRKVDIDADANYQCDKTLTAFTSQERQPVVSTSSCTYGRQVNIDADSNFQCDKTLTAFTSQERQPVVSTSSCTYGRQVNIDEDSRFQCDQTVSAYDELSCKKKTGISVTSGVTSTTGVVVLAPISDGVYLYTIGLTGVVYLRSNSGDVVVSSGAVYSGSSIGLDPAYQWRITHNYCVLNTCSGSVAPTSIMRETGPLNKYVGFSQSLKTEKSCPGDFTLYVPQSCQAGLYGYFHYECPDNNDRVYVSWTSGGTGTGSGSAYLSPGQSVVTTTVNWYDWIITSWTLIYNGNGSFSWQGYLITSCSGEGGNVVLSYSAPSITKSVTWNEINECAGLEARAQ